jgi:hypothetical protein
MTLVDFDKIEVHNLNRSVLFHKDAREKAKTHYKVDVMKVALEGLNPSVDITALNTGVLDHTTKRTKNFTEWVDDPLDRERLIRLGLQHDLCVIATDGFAPRAFIAGVLYLVMPIVQSSMNETGTLAQIKVSLPGVTGCVQCPTTSDPIHYFSDGEPNWQSTDRQYGANRCKDAAEAMGAASFAHTNSMAASFAVSQAVLLLKGWKNYTAEGCWPANLPVPLWNEVAYPRPFSPGGSRNSKTSDNVELFLETSPNGDYICYCCRKGFVDGGRLLLRAWGLMDIAEKNNL